MRLATFSDNLSTRIGLVEGDSIVDLSKACPELPREMVAFLNAGGNALNAAKAAIASPHRIALSSVKVCAPILQPPEFLITGANYRDHVAESTDLKGLPGGMDQFLKDVAAGKIQETPIIVNKQSSCVTGPTDPIYMPRVSDKLDYEGEMGVVIGKKCRYVKRDQAHQVIAGYLVVNDVSVRDWQFKSPTHTLGKSFDTTGPIGPWIVTSDELKDPHVLDLRTYVNGELGQETNTRYMIFDCYHLIEVLSTVFTLLPGTVISTGTTSGVGVVMDPPKYLKIDDVIRVEVAGIGQIENRVIKEPASIAFNG